ncbi:hypothetical protein ACFX10_028529 [Malus domestica]
MGALQLFIYRDKFDWHSLIGELEREPMGRGEGGTFAYDNWSPFSMKKVGDVAGISRWAIVGCRDYLDVWGPAFCDL